MVTLGAILLLVGAAVVSGSILKTYPYPPPFEGYGLPGNKPIIPFGVPNFYPIEAKNNCDDTVKYISSEGKKFALPHTPAQFVIEEAKFSEVPESAKPEPEVIPEAPVLPPFTLPELPFRFAVEDLAPEDVADPKLPSVIGEKQPVISEVSILSPLFSSEVPALVIEEEPKGEPIFIPEAPVLPPLTLPELPVRFNVEEPAPIVTCITVEAPEAPKIFKEITPAAIPEGPVLPHLSLPKVLIPIKAEEPASVVIIEEAPQASKDTEEPVIIPEAPMLPPLSLPQLAVRVDVEESVISASPELPAPIASIYRPEIPSITPEFVQDVVPRLPKLHEIEPFINGRSPLIIKAPVQIVIEGGADLARLASPDCIATILRGHLIPNLVEENHKVITPEPTHLLSQFTDAEE